MLNKLVRKYKAQDFYQGKQNVILLELADISYEYGEQYNYIQTLKHRGLIDSFKTTTFQKELKAYYQPTQLENEFDAGDRLEDINAEIDRYNMSVASIDFQGVVVSINPKNLSDFITEIRNRKARQNSKTIITRDSQGNLYYETEQIIFAGKGIYVKVLNILLDYADPTTGYLSFDATNKHLEEDYYQPAARSRKQIHTRIKNAISNSQGLFRYARVKDKVLQNVRPDGQPLIVKKRGEGLIFNNTK